MDYDKLIERLRNNNIENNCHDCALGYYAFESATALEKLQAENDQLRDSRDRWKKCAEDFSAGVTQRDKEEERILAENEKLRADVVRLNDMLASYQNVLVPELRVENENLKERIEDTRLEWYAKGFGEVIAEVKRVRAELEYEKEHANAYYEECGQWEAENEKLRAELERVKVERDAYQVYFKDLSSKPDCNTCEKRNCDYRPKIGATVRVNCPLYSGPQKED